MKLTSSSFAAGGKIPQRFTGDGRDASPALAWSDVPDNTRELVLVVDDPDAPSPQPWVHWVLYKIPAGTAALAEGMSKSATPSEVRGALQGKNSWGRLGYGGPAPPRGHGVHHYHFKLYALDTALDVPQGMDKNGLLARMKGHVLSEAELIGTYQR